MASLRSSFEEYWKDDFTPLEAAGKVVLNALREDEAAPDADLYRRIVSSGPGSHMYHPTETAADTNSLVHRRTVPLPPYLRQQLQTTRMSSLMGLLPEADLVWMSVDDKLFLWSSDTVAGVPAGMENFCSFVVPSGQCVVTVGLVSPKQGVFKEEVEWCLLVTTPEEIILCALARTTTGHPTASQEQTGFPHKAGFLRLVPTRFVLPTDSVPILSVCGTPSGRILLGGHDGCLYEMAYEALTLSTPAMKQHHFSTFQQRLDQFYNGNEPFPTTTKDDDSTVGYAISAAGKRALSSVFPNPQPQKCRKINHSSHASSLVSAIVPDFLSKAGSFVLGGVSSSKGGPIVKMVYDAERSCLYTLSVRGWICAFDLGGASYQHHPTKDLKLMAVMDAEKTARLYLEAVSRGRMYPPSASHSSSIANITFPGGGSSAQAGVGGMDGARVILKQADSEKSTVTTNGRRRRSDSGPNVLTPVSLHIIPRRESGRLTLMAVTAGGLRYYISSLSARVLNAGPGHHMGTSRSTDPLAPATRFSLCYVRGPPPVGDSGRMDDVPAFDLESNGGVEGYVPRMKIRPTGVPYTDAAYYGSGTMVLAVEQESMSLSTNGSSSSSRSRKFVGDVIVATAPDSMARKKLAQDNENLADGPVTQQIRELRATPGGVSETICLPMALTAPSASDHAPVLPGGRVHDISAAAKPEYTVLRLAQRSQTPTESELAVGLVPAFVPSSNSNTGRLRSSAKQKSPSRALVSARQDHDERVSTLVLTIAKNFLLSRPLREGLYTRRTLQMEQERRSMTRISHYRISARNGCCGFSATAGGKISGMGSNVSVGRSDASSTSKSARLSPWLLRPSVVPLNPLALQHLFPPDEEIIALNTGGMHFFRLKSTLVNLAQALMAPGADAAFDSKVSEFFSGYGYAQGCAMCLSLAVGCGPASVKGDFGVELKHRARRAALSRALKPKLILKDAASVAIGAVEGTDACIPVGYDFRASALYDGLSSLLSRLLRPVWYKPGVVVTEGRLMNSTGFGQTMYPAKVELLLDQLSLEEVREPLHALLSLMRAVFPPAVSVVPGIPRRESDQMDIDVNGPQCRSSITGSMLYQGFLQNQNGMGSKLSAKELESLAHLIEERNLHSVYRLLARTVQLLRLLSLLRRAHDMPELCSVEWGLLHGVTVAQLVTTRDGQERIESLLNTLVSSNVTSTATLTPSAEADQIAHLLASECYLYFSPGSRFAYSGFRAANEALSCAPASARRSVLSNQAATELKKASKYWYSAPLITGRTLHGSNDESYDRIAFRAMQYESPLAKAAAALVQLGDVESLVDVCLRTAANFGGLYRKPGDLISQLTEDASHMMPWERNLYHKRFQTDRSTWDAVPVKAPSSPTSAAVLGADVTSKDALRACHAIIFYHLSILLDSQESDLALRMVSACAASFDPKFKGALYEHLWRSKHFDALLCIENSDLEEWLKRPEIDMELLWQYYREQGKHVDAGVVMFERAFSKDPGMTLEERIGALRLSLASLDDALQFGADSVHLPGNDGISSGPSLEALRENSREVREKLDLALLQSRVKHAVESSPLGSQLDEKRLSDLRSTLIPVSELYNDYAAALNLFDICLLILQTCGHSDPSTIDMLWKSIICTELLPCHTRSEAAYQFLQNLMAGSSLDVKVTLLLDDSSSEAALFESGRWVMKLKDKVVSLGKELCRNGVDYAFPVSDLASSLEELRRCQLASAPPGSIPIGTKPWPQEALAEVGVPYSTIFDAYDEMIAREDRESMGPAGSEGTFLKFESIVELLHDWLSASRSGSASADVSNVALHDLRTSASSVVARMDAYKVFLGSLVGTRERSEAANVLYDRLNLIEREMKRIL